MERSTHDESHREILIRKEDMDFDFDRQLCPGGPIHLASGWSFLELEARVWSRNDPEDERAASREQIARWMQKLEAMGSRYDHDEEDDNDDEEDLLRYSYGRELALFLERIFVRRRIDPGGDKVFSRVHDALESALGRPAAIQWCNERHGLVIDPSYVL